MIDPGDPALKSFKARLADAEAQDGRRLHE
jgi:hypothetical protein